MKTIVSSNYKKDKLYAAVAAAMAKILKTDAVVAPVDVLIRMQRISQSDYEDWRFGRIPYLEKVFAGSLGKATVARQSGEIGIFDFVGVRWVGHLVGQSVYHRQPTSGKGNLPNGRNVKVATETVTYQTFHLRRFSWGKDLFRNHRT